MAIPVKIQAGDLWGGLAASAVVLPQAMAFGVALVSQVDLASSQGALAGLLAASLLCLLMGLVGGTIGLISAPTGPTLVLIGGALVACRAAGLAGPDILLAMTLILLMTGVLQICIGLSGGGQLIKYIPYPVTSGFMTGAAILMIESQLGPLVGSSSGFQWQSGSWIPALSALVTFLAISFGPRVFPRLPGTIAGLIVGTLAFHGLALFGPEQLPGNWLIGEIPGLDSINFSYSLDNLPRFPWQVIVSAALALSILASLDTLLTSTNPLQKRNPGIVYPGNLTPDPETGIGNWSVAQIIAMLRTGMDNHGAQSLPVMPWPAYHEIQDDDARAIDAYLLSLRPVRHQVSAIVSPGQRARFPYVHFGVYQSRE